MVTLAIIGVVAALTIPTLFAASSGEANITKWKKEFSIANQAMLSINNNGGFTDIDDPLQIQSDFAKYIKFVKTGGWSSIVANPLTAYYKNPSGLLNLGTNKISGIAIDGSIWIFSSYMSNCSTPSGSITNICGLIQIDVNGEKTPNMIGKDYFALWIVRTDGNYRVYPMGISGSSPTCVAGSSDTWTSYGCSVHALTSSYAQMP